MWRLVMNVSAASCVMTSVLWWQLRMVSVSPQGEQAPTRTLLNLLMGCELILFSVDLCSKAWNISTLVFHCDARVSWVACSAEFLFSSSTWWSPCLKWKLFALDYTRLTRLFKQWISISFYSSFHHHLKSDKFVLDNVLKKICCSFFMLCFL